jgi:hypothetical protein
MPYFIILSKIIGGIIQNWQHSVSFQNVWSISHVRTWNSLEGIKAIDLKERIYIYIYSFIITAMKTADQYKRKDNECCYINNVKRVPIWRWTNPQDYRYRALVASIIYQQINIMLEPDVDNCSPNIIMHVYSTQS